MKEGSQGWNEEEQRVHIESRVLSKIATISFTVSFFFLFSSDACHTVFM